MPALKAPARTGDPMADLVAFLGACTPEQRANVIGQLPPADVELIERVMAEKAQAGWRASPLDMAIYLSERERTSSAAAKTIQRWRYTELLSRKFVDAVEGRSKRQIWNLPARYGKSMFASQYGPAWALDAHPELNVMLISYGLDLARRNAIVVRDLLVANGDVLRARLRRDRRRADRFVTEEGGGLVAAGIDSALTGMPGDIVVIDDPFKNWVEAHSEARREKVWDFYRSVVRLRLETEDACVIVVQTRWHEDDLTGKLLDTDAHGEGEGWELVRLPALAEADDLLGRAVGEPLEPDRFSLPNVQARAVALGSYLAAGLEQQRPAPEEGTDIMRGWWRTYDLGERPPRFDVAITSWDMKLKDKEAGDFVVGQAWGRTGADFWMLDTLKGQWDVPTTKAAIALLAVRNPQCKAHIIENTGNGPELMQQLRQGDRHYVVSDDVAGKIGMSEGEREKVQRLLRRGMTSLIPENPKGDKRIRMRAQTPLIESGHVHVPDDDRGLSLVNQAAVFPNGTHDDEVDSCSQALKRLSGGGGRVEKPTGTIRTPAPGARATTRRGQGSTRAKTATRTGGRVVKPRRR